MELRRLVRSVLRLAEIGDEVLGCDADVAATAEVVEVALVAPALACLIEGKWLADDAIAVVETASDELIAPEGWDVLDTRDYGAARVWFLKPA